MNAEPRSNPVRCVVCLHAMTWADNALCDTCRYRRCAACKRRQARGGQEVCAVCQTKMEAWVEVLVTVWDAPR